MSQIVSFFIALCMIFSGGYNMDAGQPSARTIVLSCPEISYGERTAALTEDMAVCFGVQTDADRAFLDFHIINDGETLLPLQFAGETDKGLSIVFPKSGRSYLFEDLSALMDMAGIEEELPELPAEDIAEFIELCRTLGTTNLRALFNDFFNAYREANDESIVKGPPVTQEITRDGVTYPVKTYRYSTSVPDQAKAERAFQEKLAQHPVISLLGAENFASGIYYNVNSTEEHVGIDCDFYELNESYNGTNQECIRFQEGNLILSAESTIYEEGYSFDMLMDINLSENESFGTFSEKYYPEDYGSSDLEFSLKKDPESGRNTGFIDVQIANPEIPEGIGIRADLFGSYTRVTISYAGITVSFRADILDTPIEDHGAAAKEVIFDNAADMIGFSLTAAVLDSDLAALENDEDYAAFSEETNALIEEFIMDRLPDEYGENIVFIQLSQEKVLPVPMPPAASSEPLHFLAPGTIPEGYELDVRSANLDCRFVTAVLTCPDGILSIIYSDNPIVQQLPEQDPAFARNTIIEIESGMTRITRLRNGALLNILADFEMTMAEANQLLAQLS